MQCAKREVAGTAARLGGGRAAGIATVPKHFAQRPCAAGLRRGKRQHIPVPDPYHPSSGPIPPSPPPTGAADQEPEIILPNRGASSAHRSDRASLSSIPPRALLDEATAVAVEQQNSRRNRVLWTIAGTVLALLLLWTQLRSRAAEPTPPSDVPLLPAMSAAVTVTEGRQSESPAHAESALIDLDTDESPQPTRKAANLQPRVEHTAGIAAQPVPADDANTGRVREQVSTSQSGTANDAASGLSSEALRPVPRKKSWFPED